MALQKWERTNFFKSQVIWKSGSTEIDPSGNMSFIDVYDPNGDIVISESSQRATSGTYVYYVSTQSDQDLGIWVIDHRAYFDYEHPWNFSQKHNYEPFQLVKVKQN